VVLEVARSESDAVSLRAPSLAQLFLSYMLTTSLKPSLQGPNTHSTLIISPSGFPPPDPLKAAHTVQKALDHLETWSLKWRLPVNPAKCECCFFSTDPHQASHQPQLSLTGTPLLHSTLPPNSLALFLTEPSYLVRMSSPSAQSFSPASKPSAPLFLHRGVPSKSPSTNCTKHSSDPSSRMPLQDGTPSSVFTEKKFGSLSHKCLQSNLWLSRLHSCLATASGIAHPPPSTRLL